MRLGDKVTWAESQRYLGFFERWRKLYVSGVSVMCPRITYKSEQPTITCFQLSFCLLVPARVVDVAEVSTEDTDIDLLSEVPVCGE